MQTLALALHELATKSRKYGALSTDFGQLSITWHTEDDDEGASFLVLVWYEDGLPPPEHKAATTALGGYGRKLIEQALPYTPNNARTTYEMNDGSLRCTVRLPLRTGAGEPV
ncbi:hypothetical protein [Dyella sp.]|uniref:hypothetical protein n=1 Tax=Dyella sp. TaxID=1869338 RepID=UPI002B48FD62|nr:hypothetical protein [Dyella sp.]HKT27433.1 hypothetical protein [Dyella sp.]